MYCPPLFREDRLENLHALIRSHPLGLLISCGPSGPTANLVPFVLQTGAGERGVLQAHIARANPQWRGLEEQAVLVVFRGPDAYVSPSLYATKQETGKVVPTWNYAMVQARGRVKLREESDWLTKQLTALTSGRESQRLHPWAITDAPPDYIESQMKHIIGIEIEIAALEGKWKVSQNQPEANRRSVAAEFSLDERTREMAELVRLYGKLD
ncbi:MAG TPA: FMN-binding negative transcriptional regulator [Steroidobacteraceae bacterium]|nr:FMN-binding negative transcriptional regulator [Steroidobacteraceae bacterium]